MATLTSFATTKDTNDIYLGPDGNLVLVTDILAVEQLCLNAARTKLGEMVLQINQGNPFLEAVFTGVPNLNQFQAVLLVTLQSVPGVVQVLDFVLDKNKDTLSYTAEILTTYGSFNLNGSI